MIVALWAVFTVTLQVIYFGILAVIGPIIGDRATRYIKSYLMVHVYGLFYS